MPRYTEAELQNAIQDIKSGTGVSSASRKWNIPYSTLHSRYHSGWTPGQPRPAKLGKAQELELLEWARAQGQIGRRPTLSQIRERADGILAEAGDAKQLSVDWTGRFVLQHPEIADPDKPLHRKRLSEPQEKALVAWAVKQRIVGDPPTLEQIRESAQEMLREQGDDKPLGNNWARVFVERHPDASPPQPQTTTKRLSEAQEAAVVEWAQKKGELGPPPTIAQLRVRAQEILHQEGDETPLPPAWARNFTQRNPGLTRNTPAPGPKLNLTQEEDVACWISERCSASAPPTLPKIQQRAEEVLAKEGDMMPLGDRWVWDFLKRHHEVARRREMALANETAFHFSSCK